MSLNLCPLKPLMYGLLLGILVSACNNPTTPGVNTPGARCDTDPTKCNRNTEACVAGVCEPIDCSDTHRCDPVNQYCVLGRQCVQRSCAGITCTSNQECVKGICTEKQCEKPASGAATALTCTAEGKYCDALTNQCVDSNCSPSNVCPGGMFCTNGRCMGCSADANCAVGQICLAGVCQKKAALGETCEKSTDCAETTMECAPPPRSVCVRKIGQNCQGDTDCLYVCASFKCIDQKRSTGSICSADDQCPTDHICSLSSDPALAGKLICLKKDGLLCVQNQECLSFYCTGGRCDPCVSGRECNFTNTACRLGTTKCVDGRAQCDVGNKLSPDFTKCTNTTNKLVDTCFSGDCKMKTAQLRLFKGAANYELYPDVNALVADSMAASVPIYVNLTIEPGVRFYSLTTSKPAFTIDRLPKDSIVSLINKGQIYGMGGAGGDGAALSDKDVLQRAGTAGKSGGNAMHIEHYLRLDNTAGEIRGGGGGGGGGGCVYQWGSCSGHVTSLAVGGGGGGGAGQFYGQAGTGIQPSSTYFPRSKDGANGSEAGGGAGGEGGTSSEYKSPSCKFYSIAGKGGNGGDWGQPGESGVASDSSGSWGATSYGIQPAMPGGKGGYAIYRANGANLLFVDGKDAAGNVVTGKGIVMGETNLPPP